MPTLATLIKILSTSLWAHFKSFGCFIEKNRKQVFSGHCLGSRFQLQGGIVASGYKVIIFRPNKLNVDILTVQT